MTFSGFTVPYQATVFCGLLFSCSGIFNVILFTTTRPTLLPRATGASAARELSTMSFRREGTTYGGATTEPFEPSASTVTARTGMAIADPRTEGDLFPWIKRESPGAVVVMQRDADDDEESIRSSKLGSVVGASR